MNSLVRLFALAAALVPAAGFASEADLRIPELSNTFNVLGMTMTGNGILTAGIFVALAGMVFGLVEAMRIKKLPAHKSMLDISALIYETCKTYMVQQGKLLILLEVFIGACIVY